MKEENEEKSPGIIGETSLPEKLAMLKDDFPFLLESAFIAIKQMDEISAQRIFAAASLINPTHTATAIGLGQIHLNKFEIKPATAIFLGILEREPDNHLAQCFLGMCYFLTKDKTKKADELIKGAVEKSTDPTIKSLGAVILKWAEDVKKNKTLKLYNPAEDKK